MVHERGDGAEEGPAVSVFAARPCHCVRGLKVRVAELREAVDAAQVDAAHKGVGDTRTHDDEERG